MKHSIYFLLAFLLISCGNAQQSSSTLDDKKEIKTETSKSESPKVMEEPIVEAFYSIPEELINLKECLGDASKEKRKNLIQSTSTNHITFSEPCNGGQAEFAYLPDSKVYFLGVCTGTPGCEQKVYMFDESMNLIKDSNDGTEIAGFLKKNPLVKNRLKTLNMPTDPEESIIYSVNKETGMIELVPDPEFTDERVPLGRAKMVDGKLKVSQ